MELKLLSVACLSVLSVGCATTAAQPGVERAPSEQQPGAEPAPAPPEAASTTANPTPPVASEPTGPHLGSVDKNRQAPPAAAGPAPEMPPLPEGTTVLHVGDSFAGALGIPLNQRLRDVGITSVLKYRTASYIVEWAYQDELETYLSRYRPDLVLVTLGANELEIAEPERRIPAIKKIVSKIGDLPCVWIGVPLWSDRHNGLMEIVRDNSAPCRFMDSAALFPDMPRAHDKIHPTMQAREDWANKVRDWLAIQRRPTQGHAWSLATP